MSNTSIVLNRSNCGYHSNNLNSSNKSDSHNTKSYCNNPPETVNNTDKNIDERIIAKAVDEAKGQYTSKIKQCEKKSYRWDTCNIVLACVKLAASIALLYRAAILIVDLYNLIANSASASPVILSAIIFLSILAGIVILILMQNSIGFQQDKLENQISYFKYKNFSVEFLQNLLTQMRTKGKFDITGDAICKLVANTELHDRLGLLISASRVTLDAFKNNLFDGFKIENNICYIIEENNEGKKQKVKHEIATHEIATELLGELSKTHQEFHTKLLSELKHNEDDTKNKQDKKSYLDLLLKHKNKTTEPVETIKKAIIDSIST